jgi:catalase
VRYRFVPQAGERYLTPDERRAQTASCLQDDIVARVAKSPVVFDWYGQIAEKRDKFEDPSIAWPDTRQMVKLGTFALTADPMLVMRNTAYPISTRETLANLSITGHLRCFSD